MSAAEGKRPAESEEGGRAPSRRRQVEEREHREEELDEALDESFPASDPPSPTQPPDHPDRTPKEGDAA
ncbi:MAG TPA: hypothetical protein VHG92_01300 [Afifellaceae bacterium]|nr:hypothetical protein [Afifellaceae bacterium]